jgi:hypothetical protein
MFAPLIATGTMQSYASTEAASVLPERLSEQSRQ